MIEAITPVSASFHGAFRLPTHLGGYPRIGPNRELKRAIEAFWAGKTDEPALRQACRELRLRRWRTQHAAGIDLPASNDFSLYDHMLDMAVLTGAIPSRFGWDGGEVDLRTYFLMARGQAGMARDGCGCGRDHAASTEGVAALEMTKWFDTNYHYLVPELAADQTFRLTGDKPFAEFSEALEAGVLTKPVLPGPVTFLLLSKPAAGAPAGFQPLSLLPKLLPVYAEMLRRLRELGAEWVQLDEPVFSLDLTPEHKRALTSAYTALAAAAPGLKLMVANYFGSLGQNANTFLCLPVDGLHVDATRGAAELPVLLKGIPGRKVLSLGVVDGRNVWRADWVKALDLTDRAVAELGPERVWLSASCSLLHVPVSAAGETRLDAALRSRLSFAEEKLAEIARLAEAAGDAGKRAALLEENDRLLAEAAADPRLANETVRARCAAVKPEDSRRASPFAERVKVQRAALKLPLWPTTTIGSFPQTAEVRTARAKWRSGEWDAARYESAMREEIRRAVEIQTELGLDVLAHGEPERTDMVEYFGEQLDGFAFTGNGWVQSYGTRCVKPPLLFGDVSRRGPMTVRWATFAQSLTPLPVKGMLTGPITILQWSFARGDLPRSAIARQLALALRDEVLDLEAAGIRIIQIDEPALREGLPLRRAERGEYLRWAAEAFRLSAAGVRDETQIHTHMCYGEFGDIMDAIAALDADVISLEASRSQLQALDELARAGYPNDVGPGVYDIHSPRVPKEEEMLATLERAARVLPVERLWVNPDCGLKTRRWEEVVPALKAMVNVARRLRRTAGAEAA